VILDLTVLEINPSVMALTAVAALLVTGPVSCAVITVDDLLAGLSVSSSLGNSVELNV
jgi:hypothetical protein